MTRHVPCSNNHVSTNGVHTRPPQDIQKEKGLRGSGTVERSQTRMWHGNKLIAIYLLRSRRTASERTLVGEEKQSQTIDIDGGSLAHKTCPLCTPSGAGGHWINYHHELVAPIMPLYINSKNKSDDNNTYRHRLIASILMKGFSEHLRKYGRLSSYMSMIGRSAIGHKCSRSISRLHVDARQKSNLSRT